MNTERIIADLKQERDRITAAIDALEGLHQPTTRRGRRHMSAEARARISKAMKARWAERKKKKAPASGKVHELRAS